MKRELFSVALAPLSIDKDLLGNPRSASAPKVGPFENLKVGENTIMVWKFKK